jgi:hypothetical protein
MSVKLTVTIKQDGKEILYPLADRPVRITPLAIAGIVYQGVVYPLHEGNFIELTDETFEKSDCSEYAADADSLIYVEDFEEGDTEDGSVVMPERWHVEHNAFGNYLVFDANENVACKIVERIEESGLGVRRWDASSREADDGYQYDWFIRLRFNGSRDDCTRRIEEVLARPSSGDTAGWMQSPLASVTGDDIGAIDAEPSTDEAIDDAPEEALREALLRQLAPLVGATEEAIRRAEVAEGALSEARKECLALKAAETALNASLASEKASHAHVEVLFADAQSRADVAESEVKALRATIANNNLLNNEVSRQEFDLRARLAKAERERDTAHAALSEAKEKLAAASATIAKTNAQIQELEVEWQAATEKADVAEKQLADASRQEIAKTNVHPPAAKRQRREASLEIMLRRLWNRLVVHPDAIASLTADFSQWKAVFKVLSDLNDKNSSIRYESFRSHDVFEVRDHIPTGRDPMGRVYFRRLPYDMLWVFIHRKKDERDQERFVRRIAGYDLMQADVGM